MGLKIHSRAADPVDIVVPCDPAVRAANPIGADGEDPLERYAETLDLDTIVVPPDATRITIRVLREAETRLAQKRTGRMPERGRLIAVRQGHAVAEAYRLAAAGHAEASDAAIEAGVAYTESLSDADHAAHGAYEAWIARSHIEAARLGVLSISDWPDLAPGPDGYPIERVLDEVELGGISAATFVSQIASAIDGVSTLGKARRRSSTTPSGATTSGPTPGPASGADEAATDDASTATHCGPSTPSSLDGCA